MAFTEDFTAFFNPADFAVNATLAGVAVQGIFDAAYLMQDDMGTASSAPAFTLASSAVPAVSVGLSLMVARASYAVVEPMADGTGVTVLRLRKA